MRWGKFIFSTGFHVLRSSVPNLAENLPSVQKVEGSNSRLSAQVITFLNMAAVQVSLPLPVLPQGWSEERDFKPIGQLSSATQRNIEPVGPHFLAHARRVCHSLLCLYLGI